MSLGEELQNIRNKNNMTQEELGSIVQASKRTISNWEKGISYPDLETIIKISDKFGVSLDRLLKNDEKMTKIVDYERKSGMLKRKKSFADTFIGIGAGLIISCLLPKDQSLQIFTIVAGFILVTIGWYKHFKISGKF